MSHETYLESFIDQITTTPHELRRNLELIKELDKSCTSIVEELRNAEQEYVRKAEEKVLKLELLPMNDKVQKKQDKSSSSINKKNPSNKSSSKKRKSKSTDDGDDGDDGDDDDDVNNSETNKDSDDEEKKPLTYGIKVLGNNPPPVDKKIPQPKQEKSTPAVSTKSSSKKRKTRGATSPSSSTQQSPPIKKQRQEPIAIIPTSEELSAYIHRDNDNEYNNILSLRSEAMQQADEKVAIAEQAYSLVDATVKRLDSDLAKLETLLKNSGEFIPSSTTITTGGMSASALSSGMHLNHSDMDNMVGVGSSTVMTESLGARTGGGEAILLSRSGSVVGRGVGAGSSGLGSGGHGGPIIPGLGRPNELVAICTNSKTNPHEWILGKIISYNKETGMYKISDEDIESNHKVFTLPDKDVVILGSNPPRGNQRIDKIAKGDVIFAVYPDTTSFYQATIVQGPRKLQGSDSSDNSMDNSFVLVNFIDDGDEHGITHDKAVLLKHCMRVPKDVPIQ